MMWKQAAERRMKRQLAELSEKDPEFHKYLKDNKESLLEYGGDKDENDKEEEEESAAGDQMDGEEQEDESDDERVEEAKEAETKGEEKGRDADKPAAADERAAGEFRYHLLGEGAAASSGDEGGKEPS